MTERVAPSCALLEQGFPESIVRLPSGAQVAMRSCGVAGERPALVLLHGISSGAGSWLQSALALGEQTRVVAWDAPGYGASTPLAAAAPAAADYAARLHEWLQALEIRRCVLAGQSLGALMATAYAHGLGASRVERLVLISPAAGYGSRPADSERMRRERSEALARLGIEGLAARIDQRLLSPAAGDAERAWVRWNTARMNPPGYLQALELLCGGDLAADGPLAMPVEVHCGDADVVSTPQECRALAQQIGARFELIGDAGHASPIEQPAAVARLLANALGVRAA
jgi:pimeloyl-ACP methyl ester carboxylesterase